MNATVYSMDGKKSGMVSLPEHIFGVRWNADLVKQVADSLLSTKRKNVAHTKDRSEVRGGGRKPWKQKGTGRARHASRRSPIWRGGGVTFGPSPRDYSYALPPVIKRGAVVQVMKDKILNKKLLFMNQISVDSAKTKDIAKLLKTLKLEKPLFMVEKKDNRFLLASRNIPGVAVKTAGEVNSLDIVSHKECVTTKGAYGVLLKRLKS